MTLMIVKDNLTATLKFSVASYDVQLQLDLRAGDHVAEVVRQTLAEHALPCYLEPSATACLFRLLQLHEAEAAPSSTLSPSKDDLTEKARQLSERFQTHHQSLRQALQEPLFPFAYHHLIHSTGFAFEVLLDLERKYMDAIGEVLSGRDRAVHKLRIRQAEEMEAAAKTDPTSAGMLVNKHLEDMELLQATWTSELEELKRTQRQDYREFVISYYKESIASASSSSSVKQPSSDSIAISVETEPSTPTLVINTDSKMAALITELTEMGFGMAQAECALNLADGNRDEAIMFLLEKPAKIEEILATSAPSPTTKQPRSPLKQGKAESSKSAAKTDGTKRTAIAESIRNLPVAAVLPEAAVKGRAALEVAQSLMSSAWTRLGLQKQTSAAAPDERAVVLNESFTVQLGSQHKTLHQFRLVCVPQGGLFEQTSDQQQHAAQRAQTAMTLYSTELIGVVLLSPVDALSKKRVGHAGLEKACERSTEFHFEDLDMQLKLASEQLFVTQGTLKAGDFFVTRHSNLPLVHVIFHLLSDLKGLSGDGIARSPVMTGLRGIMKVAAKHDITTLSIPLLMTTTETTGILADDLPNALRRAELVLKCIKGFLLENARSGKQSQDIRLLQFLLPAGTTSEQFAHFRTQLATVFRVLN